MVCISVFELFPQAEAVDTPTLEARDGGTLGGMERGMGEGYERLEALVQKLGMAA